MGLLKSDAFWRYQGSLTTPPCSEIVAWHVMMEPLYITQAQIDTIEGISKIPNNFRPPKFREVQINKGDMKPIPQCSKAASGLCVCDKVVKEKTTCVSQGGR